MLSTTANKPEPGRNIVVVVGAGATRAVAQNLDPKPAVLPPLNCDFFDICEKKGIKGHKKIRAYTSKRFGLQSLPGSCGMEEVFNLIYSDAFPEPQDKDSQEVYRSLVRMYQGAITNTTNDLNPVSGFGVYTLVHELLSRCSDAQMSFVTFNHDLMIERALQALSQQNLYLRWNIKKAYVIDFAKFAMVPTNPKPFSTSDEESVHVLKLHGSLNWVHKTGSAKKRADGTEAGAPRLYCVNHRKARVHFKLNSSETQALIVPPIFEKSPVNAQLLQPLWRQAATYLTNANVALFFGYSFPHADVRAWCLFKSALTRNTNLEEIVVINPDPSVTTSAARLAQCIPIRPCTDVRAFVRSLTQQVRSRWWLP